LILSWTNRLLRGLFILLLGLFGAMPAKSSVAAEVLVMAAGTTLEASGFLRHILPKFTADTGIPVRAIAVGTGRALAMGRRGDADILFVHHPEAEKRFLAEGWASARIPVMETRFLLVGPEPIEGGETFKGAFDALQRAERLFFSRGDESGTHAAEMTLWRELGIEPAGRWYRETGQGMGQTLALAAELDGYTLVDSATWATHQRKAGLRIIAEQPVLPNPYSVLLINGEKLSDINETAAQAFANWLTSSLGQAAIAGSPLG